jgi:ketose-bisphosphate aldolase
MIVRAQEILTKAQKGGYAVGAFNTNNLEITQAIVAAAEELKSPVIIQTTPSAIEYAGLEEIYTIVLTAIANTKIPAVLHLDHGKHFEIIKQAVDIGYPSVMIDASILSFEENVRLVQRVVKYAHQKGVAVESEIGAIGLGEEGVKEGETIFTDPSQAAEFVKLTGVDSLGVSIGNAHGAPKGEKINVALLKEIKSKVNIPLVLHGSSGLSTADIHHAVRNGICKINIDTNIRRTAIEAMKEELDKNPKDYRNVLGGARDEVKKLVMRYIRILGSEGKG